MPGAEGQGLWGDIGRGYEVSVMQDNVGSESSGDLIHSIVTIVDNIIV